MYNSDILVRVRYGETDKMGYAYYGNYATYFEVARVELLRKLGISYKQMEDDGYMLPVYEFSVKYYKPAYYDDELRIHTEIRELPYSRITFHYKTYNDKDELLNEAQTTLVFVNTSTGKPCQAPENFNAAIQPFFEN